MPTEDVTEVDVEKLRGELETAIDEAVSRLRSMETTAQQRLRQASIEQQHLESFLEELHYRLRYLQSSGIVDICRAPAS